MFRTRPAFLIVALSSLALAATGRPQPAKPEAAKRQLTIGFSQCGSESGWRTAETTSIKDEAARRNIKLKFSDAEGKQQDQIGAIRSFVTQKVDAIILAPKIETGWDTVLAEAKAAGIPVILVDRGIKTRDDSLYATLIASDFIEEGRMAAEWLATKMNGRGNIVELQGSTGAAPANDRRKGFADELAKHPEMRIIKSQSGDFTRAKGKEVMEAFIKSDAGKVQAVYAHNDDMALGAIQALEEAGMKPGTEVIVVSIDGLKTAFEAMIAGKLNCTVECNPLLGPAAFDTVEKILAGQTVPKFIKNTDRLFDQSNAAKELPGRQY
jgi:ABC-type sugar transport system substrate-binding protein